MNICVFSSLVVFLLSISSCVVHGRVHVHDGSSAGSQIGQDDWVLNLFGGPRYFVEVGSFDGYVFSNTHKLEKAGWTGLCVDPFPRNFNGRSCKVVKAAVAGSARNVTFVEAHTAGGIQDLLGTDKEGVTAAGRSSTLQTRTLEEILDEADAPSYIEYLSLDTEGSELDILATFPFWKYRFGAITVETNSEEPKRSKIRELLTHNGYSLERDAFGQDDWFVSECVSSHMMASYELQLQNGRTSKSLRKRRRSSRHDG